MYTSVIYPRYDTYVSNRSSEVPPLLVVCVFLFCDIVVHNDVTYYKERCSYVVTKFNYTYVCLCIVRVYVNNAHTFPAIRTVQGTHNINFGVNKNCILYVWNLNTYIVAVLYTVCCMLIRLFIYVCRDVGMQQTYFSGKVHVHNMYTFPKVSEVT
jgi:hypothetical protein